MKALYVEHPMKYQTLILWEQTYNQKWLGFWVQYDNQAQPPFFRRIPIGNFTRITNIPYVGGLWQLGAPRGGGGNLDLEKFSKNIFSPKKIPFQNILDLE